MGVHVVRLRVATWAAAGMKGRDAVAKLRRRAAR
jgi:hypothetical protein